MPCSVQTRNEMCIICARTAVYGMPDVPYTHYVISFSINYSHTHFDSPGLSLYALCAVYDELYMSSQQLYTCRAATALLVSKFSNTPPKPWLMPVNDATRDHTTEPT